MVAVMLLCFILPVVMLLRFILLLLGLQKQKKMSEGSSQVPVSLGSQPETDSHPESFNESEANQSEAIEMDDDEDEEVEEEEEDGVEVGSKRKLTSVVWKEFKRVRWNGKIKAKCMYCSSKLGGETRSGTKHLHDHLKICTLRKIHLSRNKTLSQASLRFNATDSGKVSVENYTFDQEIERKELGAMMVLHEYPLSMVDHAGFRRFVHALQPLFKIGTRNTLRKHTIDQYELERKKAIQYMAGIKSRVAITSDMWTSDNQKRGYMAITTHFIDESWAFRNIIMRFIYVLAPHTHDVIGDELYESLVNWNLDEKDGLEMLKDAIENLRDSVAYWTATPKRIEKFEEIAKHGVDCEDEVTKVKESLSDLMLEYHLEEDDEPRVNKASAPAVGNSGFMSSFSARVASTKSAAIRFRSELVRYLKDEMVDILTKDFDIIDWWKVAGTRYPTLRLIAIPITTVASESAFSTSGRVLSEHHSRLTSQMLEALMC
ncbi:zinc finger BED domain-containing protein RICESLEEPER 2-like [Setaria viridis]|uniref:zinc finger BED domain-containing protein RICESLEEPER 2-like n=1 Tax=Setaria viridis TaxID=4556 RepID=UPI003B3B4B07